MGVSNIIHFLGMILVCLSLVVVPLVKIKAIELARAVTTLSIIVGSITMAWTPALWARTKTLVEKDTFYHRIRIEEDDEARYMYFDRTLQSHELEGSYGAAPDLFALYLVGVRL